MTNKRGLRNHYKAIREDMESQQVMAASRALCLRLAEWEMLHEAASALTYVAFRNEIDLSALLTLRPDVHWSAPRVEGRRLVLHTFDPERLVRHRFGMLEPAADLPVVEARALDVVLVPGVAFDRHGGRLGFGGGFYDRLLPTTQALRVGVTHDRCMADRLPMQDYDEWMDWVVTPTQLFQCPARPR